MFFIGPPNTKGTYFWYSEQQRAWITADLDLGKARTHDKLATIEVILDNGVTNVLESKAGLGQDGDRWLVDGLALILLLRDYADQIKVLMVYYIDGTEKPYGKDEVEVAKVMKKIRKQRKLKDGD
jgi:hypothetical protein